MAVRPTSDEHSATKIPRRYPRQKIETLVYVDLGCENGGFPLDISEGGVAFQGIRPLKIDRTLCIVLKLPGIGGSVTATAKIAWLNNSQKGGALQFIDLPQDSRLLLAKWLSEQRQAGNPKENSTAAASGVVTDVLPPISAISLQASRGKSPEKVDPVVAAPPIPASSASEESPDTISAVAPRFEPYVPDDGAKESFRIRLLVFVLSISMIAAGINFWRLRVIQFPREASNHPTPSAVTNAPVAEAQFPLANPGAPELSSDRLSVSAAAAADDSTILTSPAAPAVTRGVPSRAAAKARARALQIQSAKLSKIHLPPAQDTRRQGAALATAPSRQPLTAAPNPASAGVTELRDSVSAGARNSSPADNSPRESASVGSVEIKSDPHPSVRMTPEMAFRASWPGIDPKFGRLISSVEPVYPKEALQQHIAGTVHLHVVVGRSGTVEKVEPKDGPALLADAALRAVQQWHFEPTIVAGQPIEAEQNITIVFRLANTNATPN